MKVKFKKLGPEAKVPKKGHPTDAGFDLTATSRRMDKKGFNAPDMQWMKQLNLGNDLVKFRMGLYHFLFNKCDIL